MSCLRLALQPGRLSVLTAAASASTARASSEAGPTLVRFYAANSSNPPPRVAPARRPIRSLAEIEADKMEIRARASGARWLPTTESGEDAEMTVFDRPPNAPIWAVLLFTVSMTSCFTAASLAMTDLLDKEVASEEPPAGDDILLADGTFQPADSSAPSSVFGSVLGYLPSKMPNVSSTWAYINGALAVAVPLAVLYIASRTGARVVRYRPSGRMRVYTRLDNQLGKGKLIDFGIAEGILENGATKDNLQIVRLHLPPLGFDPADKQASVKLPTVTLDVRPLDEEVIVKLRAAGQNAVVDQALLAQAFGGISTRKKERVEIRP